MVARPPQLDPNDPTSIAVMFQWLMDQISHLHECVERVGSEALKVARSNEELSESRHMQNTAALGEIREAQKAQAKLWENAEREDVVKAAVTAERTRAKVESLRRWDSVRGASGKVALLALGILLPVIAHHFFGVG